MSWPGKAQYSVDSNGSFTGLLGPDGYQIRINRAVLPKNYPHTRKALANVKTGTSNMRVALVGDSTDLGKGAANAGSFTGARPFNPAAQLAKYLTASGITANNNSFFGSGAIGADSTFNALYDPRITGSTAFTTTGAYCMGGQVFTATAAGTLSFNPTSNLTNYEIHYIDGPGTFTVDIGGAAGQTIVGGNTLTMKTVVTQTVAGMGASNIKWVSGTIYPYACIGWNNAIPEVIVANMGWNGSKAADWANLYGVNYNPINSLKLFAPDLTIIRAGINDWNAATSPAAFATSLSAVVAAAQISGDVLIETSPYGAFSGATLAIQQGLIAAMKAVAKSYGCDFNDNSVRWDSQVNMAALGYYDPDNLHYSKVGYSDLATSTLGCLLSL